MSQRSMKNNLAPKKFPNLFPEDLPRLIQRSKLEFCDGKWREIMPNRESRTASGIYNFVTQDGIVLMRKVSAKVGSSLIGHVDLAMGREVDYAGRLYFSGRTNRGILRYWTNESGHYRPTSEFSRNAGLPELLFRAGQFDSLASVRKFPKKN